MMMTIAKFVRMRRMTFFNEDLARSLGVGVVGWGFGLPVQSHL